MACLTQSRFRGAVVLFILLSQALALSAASKLHVITLGKWATVQGSPDFVGGSESEKLTLKVRPLLVDARVKEFTLGATHEITDRLFVVRRAFRINDSLPQESTSPPHWQWQRGGWLLVDRLTGHISPITLPEFDILYSAASWYRDYVAYCGVSDDGKKLYAVVAQVSRRKPVLKKLLDSAGNGEIKNAAADSACPVPTWQRNPSRVSFEIAGGPKQTFAIRGHSVDLITQEEEDDEEASK